MSTLAVSREVSSAIDALRQLIHQVSTGSLDPGSDGMDGKEAAGLLSAALDAVVAAMEEQMMTIMRRMQALTRRIRRLGEKKEMDIITRKHMVKIMGVEMDSVQVPDETIASNRTCKPEDHRAHPDYVVRKEYRTHGRYDSSESEEEVDPDMLSFISAPSNERTAGFVQLGSVLFSGPDARKNLTVSEQKEKLDRIMRGKVDPKPQPNTIKSRLLASDAELLRAADQRIREALSCHLSSLLESCAHLAGVERARLYIPQYRDDFHLNVSNASEAGTFVRSLRLIAAVPDPSVVTHRGGLFFSPSNSYNLCAISFQTHVALAVDNVSDDLRRVYLLDTGGSSDVASISNILLFPIIHPLFPDQCVGVIELINKVNYNHEKRQRFGQVSGSESDDKGRCWTKDDEQLCYYASLLMSYHIHRYQPLMANIALTSGGGQSEVWPVFQPQQVLLKSTLSSQYQPLTPGSTKIESISEPTYNFSYDTNNDAVQRLSAAVERSVFSHHVPILIARVTDLEDLSSVKSLDATVDKTVAQTPSSSLPATPQAGGHSNSALPSIVSRSDTSQHGSRKLDKLSSQIQESGGALPFIREITAYVRHLEDVHKHQQGQILALEDHLGKQRDEAMRWAGRCKSSDENSAFLREKLEELQKKLAMYMNGQISGSVAPSSLAASRLVNESSLIKATDIRGVNPIGSSLKDFLQEARNSVAALRQQALKLAEGDSGALVASMDSQRLQGKAGSTLRRARKQDLMNSINRRGQPAVLNQRSHSSMM